MSKRTPTKESSRRAVPRQTKAEPRRVGMDQLSYFARMVSCYLDESRQERFWKLIRENCPELMQGIEASFADAWQQVLFTRDLISPAFDPEALLANEEDHV
jgi:hypothetical protein